MSTTGLYVIVGLGATGLSCARYLHRQGIPIAVTDTRIEPPHLPALLAIDPHIPLSLGELDVDLLEAAHTIVLSPGIALAEPAIAAQVAKGKPVIGDIELFARGVEKNPVIAITGTNAKSTVTTLVGEMVKAAGYQTQVGGNLGTPALDLLTHHDKEVVYVLELSSFQLETTFSLQPTVATVLNITPDHMDRYEDLAHYQKTKLRIYEHCKTAVCNKEDELTFCANPQANVVFFTLQKPATLEFGILSHEGKPYLAHGNKALLAISDLPVMGKHYQANALAALAIGYSFGLPFEPMLEVLRSFKGLPHRCQFVRELNQVKWYNDSKGTNVGATLAAIEGLGSEISGKLVLIAGGVGKNADFTPLLPVLEKYTRHIVLIGEAASILERVIDGRLKTSMAADMQEAVLQAKAIAHPTDSVLLSPACASLDMFKNYEHRGEVFMEIVQKL